MKKYLLTGMAAIMFCGVFTSCSRDTDFGQTKQQQIQETYEEAFISRFGTPSPNLDWGFGERTTAATRALNLPLEGTSWIRNTPKARTRGTTTVKVSGEWYYSIPANFNPTDGQTVEVKGIDENGNERVFGILTFHGTNGTASVFDNSKYSPLEYYVTRKAISFTSYCNISQAYFKMDGDYAPFLWTDNGTPISQYGATYDGQTTSKNGETNLSGMVQAGHTYRVEYPSQNLKFWGFKVAHYGDLTIEAPNNGGDNNGGNNNGGDNNGGNNNGGDNNGGDNNGGDNNGGDNNGGDNNGGDNNGGDTDTSSTTTIIDNGTTTCTVTDDFPVRFTKDYFDAIQANMPEWGPTTGSKNYEFVSNGPFEFSVIFSCTSAHDEIGYYYYDPNTQTVAERTEVRFVEDMQYPGNYYRIVRSYTDDYLPGAQDGYGIWNWGDVSAVKAKVFTIDVPEGYRVGFWIDNPDWPRFYSNQALNPDQEYYSAVVDLDANTFLVGLEDWYKGDNDCNDIIISVKKGTTPPDVIIPDSYYEEIRVMAEDLSVDQSTDFDFNDIVFDVRRYTKVIDNHSVGDVEVVLLAAGGTLPLYILSVDDDHEVHKLFGVDQYTMVNTNASHRGYKGKDNARPVTIPVPNPQGTTIGEIARNIPVYVIKNGETCTLSAPNPTEGIASKIGVGTDYEWCDERQDIDDKFHLAEDGTSLFTEWVTGEYPEGDWYRFAKARIADYRAAKEAANNSTNP